MTIEWWASSWMVMSWKQVKVERIYCESEFLNTSLHVNLKNEYFKKSVSIVVNTKPLRDFRTLVLVRHHGDCLDLGWDRGGCNQEPLYPIHSTDDSMPEVPISTKPMIEQIFNDAATAYDSVGPSIFAQFGERLVDHMHLAPGMRVLDIATGKGAALIPAAHLVGPKGRVIGVDISDAMLQEAEHVVQREGLTNVELHKMDAEHLEFPNQSFDAVTCAFALFFFPDIEAALREMHRVCKPGCCLAITYFNKTPPPLSPGFPILIQQLLAYGVGVQTPQPIAYTPQEVETLLNRFRSIEIYNEINDILYKSEEEWWSFLLTMASRASIMGMTEEMRARFKEEYLAKLRPMVGEDGLHMALAIIYALARR